MKKIKEMIMKDIGWKLLSAVIAIGLWFMVINIENPIESRNFVVNVNVTNTDALTEKGYIISNADELNNLRATIRVRGQRMSLDRLNQSRGNIEASVDIEKALNSVGNESSIALGVDVKLPTIAGETFEIVSKNPSIVYLKVDSIKSVEKKIQASVSGEAAVGYVLGTPVLSKETVTVSGPSDLVASVSYVKTEVSIEAPSENVALESKLTAYNSKNEAVEGVTLSENTVNITIPVSKSKRISIVVNTIGLPADGYTIKSVSWTPQNIDVVGSEVDLAKISQLVLPVVNVEGETQDISESYKISSLLPDGVNLKNDSEENVSVNVSIEKDAEKTIYVSSEKVTLTGTIDQDLKATFSPQNIAVRIRGEQSLINSVTQADISGTASIAGLDAGTHNVKIDFDLPDGISIVGDEPQVTIVISENTSDGGDTEESVQGTEH